jgi:hypothetical protein
VASSKVVAPLEKRKMANHNVRQTLGNGRNVGRISKMRTDGEGGEGRRAKINITLLKASNRSECNTYSVNSGYTHQGRTNRRQGKAEAVVSLEVGELRLLVASDIQPNAKRLLVPIVGHVQDGEVACMRKRRLR